MASTGGRVIGKRIVEALGARQFSISRVVSKGKHVPPPPPPAYGPGATPGASTTPVKPSSAQPTPAPAKEAAKPPSGSGVPSAAAKPAPATPGSAALQQKTRPSEASPPAASAPQPQSSNTAGKDPAGGAASSKPLPKVSATPALSSAPASKPTPAAPSKVAEAAAKEQPKSSAAPGAPVQQPAPETPVLQQQKPPSTEAVKITGPEPPPAASAGGVGKDRAKQAYFTGGTAARSGGDHQRPPQGNAWLVSKSLPVDVRLLAAGAASIGALYYYSSWQQQPPPPSEGGGDSGAGSDSFPGSGDSFAAGEELAGIPEIGAGPAERVYESSNGGDAPLTVGSESHFHTGSAGDFYTDELAMQNGHSADENHEEKPGVAQHTEEEAPVPLPPPETSKLKKTLQEEITSAAKAVEASIQNGQPLEHVDTKPVTDLLNEVGTGSWQLVELPGGKDEVTAVVVEVEAPDAASSEVPAHKISGATDNISADALLRRAVERAEREGRAWAMSHENLVQARADEQTFREILEKERTVQQVEVAAAMAVAEANAKRAKEIQAAADASQERFAQILEDTVRLSNLQRDQELLRQAEYLTTAAAEAAVRERSERAGALDELRSKVNALGQAFSRRSDEQRDSTRAHQVSLGAFALEDALVHGRPFAAAASLLSQSCSEDDLVAAALQALPKDSNKGIPTHAELLQRAPAVAQNARQMAYIQPGSGGIVSLGLARLAARLKVPEGSAGSGEGTDGALARMQSHLAAGQLAEAADALEAGTKGTAAEAAASEWARDARARALADQTTALLQAHACSLAVSQS